MPAQVISLHGFSFGVVPLEELPILPAGWRYKRSNKDWVLAICPEGRAYIVGSDKAFPLCVATEADVARTAGELIPFKIGQRFIDAEHPIALTPRAASEPSKIQNP